MNKLYIGNLPADVNEGSIRELFHEHTGAVPKSVLVKKGGYAFVECADDETISKAIETLNGHLFMGSQLLVEPQQSAPQNRRSRGNRVQVGNIPSHVQREEIQQLLSTFGTVQNLELVPSKPENSTYRVQVTYETPDQAQQAVAQLRDYEYEGSVLKTEYSMDANGRNGGGGRNHMRPGGGNRPMYRPFSYAGNQGSSLRPSDFPLRILVLSDMVGAIIGRAGGTIRQITQQSRARVDVHRKENAGSLEKVITIYGNPDNCSTACQKILEVMQQEASNTNRGEVPLKILAHNNLIGRIIGKSGNTIKRIMEQTDTKITVSSLHDGSALHMERVISIKGKPEGVCRAEQLVSSKLRQSYESDLAAMAPQSMMFPGLHPLAMMAYSPMHGPGGRPPHHHRGGHYGGGPHHPSAMHGGGYMGGGGPHHPHHGGGHMGYPPMGPNGEGRELVCLYIPNSAVGAIIGTGGSSIRDMIMLSGASIKVAQPNKDDPADAHERKVTIVGTPESQWRAQSMIFSKVCYENVVANQDGTLRVEIFVPSNQVGRIIGKGGQTVRELQRLTRALIKLPEESQNANTEETPVHILGDFFSTHAAQRQIRALVNRNQMVGGGPGQYPMHPRMGGGPRRGGGPQQGGGGGQRQQQQPPPPSQSPPDSQPPQSGSPTSN